jgi:uncharacterized surface protein with fasciclin (FAS1) repeats
VKGLAVIALLIGATLPAAAQPTLNPKLARATGVAPTLKAAGMNTFLSLLDVVGLENLGVMRTSTSAGPGGGPRYHTLFVPTDLAFSRMPAGALDALKRDPERLREFLLGHLVKGNITIGELPAEITDGTSHVRKQLKTRRGTVLNFKASAQPGTNFPLINDKVRVGAFQDVHVSDYRLVIHEIDAVL